MVRRKFFGFGFEVDMFLVVMVRVGMVSLVCCICVVMRVMLVEVIMVWGNGFRVLSRLLVFGIMMMLFMLDVLFVSMILFLWRLIV